MLSAFIRTRVPKQQPGAECNSKRIVPVSKHKRGHGLIEEPGFNRAVMRVETMNEKPIYIGPIQRLFSCVPDRTFPATVPHRCDAHGFSNQGHTASCAFMDPVPDLI